MLRFPVCVRAGEQSQLTPADVGYDPTWKTRKLENLHQATNQEMYTLGQDVVVDEKFLPTKSKKVYNRMRVRGFKPGIDEGVCAHVHVGRASGV